MEPRRYLAITVDTTLDVVDFNDGVTSLREAISISNTTGGTDTIDFAPMLTAGGPAKILLKLGELVVTDSLTVNGLGAELLTIDASGNDKTPNSTLDDGISNNDGDGSRVFRVQIYDGDPRLEFAISALTLMGGDARFDGGAILAEGPITVSHCVLKDNICTGSGGAISTEGTATVFGSVFHSNTAGSEGGGISADGSIEVRNSEFISNKSRSIGGGAIYANSSLSFLQSTAFQNSSNGPGGAIAARSELVVEDCNILGNGAGGMGGGIFAQTTNSTPVIRRSIISGNTAGAQGGGVFAGNTLSFEDSTISDNRIIGGSIGRGGGISALRPSILNCLVQNNGGTGRTYGGAVWGDIVTISGSTVVGNFAAGLGSKGGAIFASQLQLTDSTIQDNRTLGYESSGGAIWSRIVTAADSTISGNYTRDQFSPGGAIFCEELKLSNSEMTDNYTYGATSPGGAVYCLKVQGSATVELNNSSILRNWTNGTNSGGGGIFVSNELTAFNSDVSGNFTKGRGSPGGGILQQTASQIEFSGSNVSDNSTLGDGSRGGGIAAREVVFRSSSALNNATYGQDAPGGGISTGYISLIESVVSGNTTHGRKSHGGGIYVDGWFSSAIRTTIVKNRADGELALGGGLWTNTMFNNGITLDGTIIAENLAAGGSPDIRLVILSFDRHFSLIGNRAGTNLGESLVGSPDSDGNLVGGPVHGVIDPKLGPIVYNGGPTFLDGSKMLTHALLPGSPAINIGDPAAVAGMNDVPEFDQRGGPWSRVVGGRIDMGAIESQANPLPGDYNFNGKVDAADYSVWRDTMGATNDLRADGSGPVVGMPDGIVDGMDYAFWKANFGNELEVGGAGGAALAGELRLAGTAASEKNDLATIGANSAASNFFFSSTESVELDPVRDRRGVARRLFHTDVERDDALATWVASRARNIASRGDGDLPSDATELDCEKKVSEIDRVFAMLGDD